MYIEFSSLENFWPNLSVRLMDKNSQDKVHFFMITSELKNQGKER